MLIKARSKKSRFIDIESVYRLLKKSSRPVILTGGGVRYSNAVKEFNSLVKALKIPVVSSWSGVDTIDFKNKLYFGHVGVYGSRAANFIVQNSDCLLSLGSRLDTRITGGKPETFIREGKLIMVDIDKGELSKRRGLKPHLEINEDCKVFINKLF